jgi:hypothetical protein
MSIELEEKDWRDAKEAAIEEIRKAKLSLELNSLVLERAEKEIKKHEEQRLSEKKPP